MAIREWQRSSVVDLVLVEGREELGVIAFVFLADPGHGVLWYNARLVAQGATLWYVRSWARYALESGRHFDALGSHQFPVWPPV